jgi:hypothetical protein
LRKIKADNSQGKRTLVVLEDLGLCWMDMLRSNLHVPVTVFARHWANPAYHNDGKVRVPLGQDFHTYYILNYNQEHAIDIAKVDKGFSVKLLRNLDNVVNEVQESPTE